jgi:hypothetical protein
VIYFCSQKNRRALVLQHAALNGIDYLEVQTAGPECGKRLFLTMLKDARSLALSPSQLRITVGGNASPLHVVSVAPATNAAPRLVTLELNQAGDYSLYNLALVANPSISDPPDGIDPQLSTVDFSFKAGCPTVGDCLPNKCCPPETTPEPDINYLAKDYGGFRQVMLDRMAVLSPSWNETHTADMGIALVELLAYAADHLSYQQDAAGTESYLGTARSRISLRRHAKLVDYRISEGCNARAWVYVSVWQDTPLIPSGTMFYPRVPGLPTTLHPGSAQALSLENTSTLGFAALQDSSLYVEQNQIQIYTWGDADCCLANGATEATFAGTFKSLAPGQVVIFEEVVGPDTGDPEDANPHHRWAVRLTEVRTTDYMGRTLADPLNGQPVTEVSWSAADALPFPLCISSTTDADHGSRQLTGVSVACGNIIPADHGVWQPVPPPGVPPPVWEDLGVVPPPPAAPAIGTSCACQLGSTVPAPRPRYFPQLSLSPVTFALAADLTAASSQFLAAPSPGSATRPVPAITVQDDQGQSWSPLDDLLSSNDTERVYVLEIERDGKAFLRFGDGQYGMAPETGTDFQARYRVGNGTAGNIGRDTLGHIITNLSTIVAVRNPLAAAGGVDPETMDHIRQQAPFAFRTQLRAVTEEDYGVMAEQDPAIREARGTFRWAGSWYSAFVSVDPAAEGGLDASLLTATKTRLNLLRMAGVDLAVEGAVPVGLRIEMNICVDPNHFRSDVHAALLQLFTTGTLCDGRRGVLNPANFTFGQTIYTSPLVAAAQSVQGVASATMTVFQRMDDPSVDGVALSYLIMGRLEIARCDNNPDRLDLGVLLFHMDGGK